MGKKASLLGLTSHLPSMDMERDIFDYVCSLNLMEVHKKLSLIHIQLYSSCRVIKSNLGTAVIPHTYPFPEFITLIT